MSKKPTSHAEYLKKTLDGAVKESSFHYDHEIITIEASTLKKVVQILKGELGFDMLLDVSALDFKKWRQTKPSRFEVDYFFYSVKNNERIQLKVPVPGDEHPTLDTITDIYPIANWPERECWDMMGIVFAGHPNLKRLLMWEEFQGHPLRKDYPIDKRQPLPLVRQLL